MEADWEFEIGGSAPVIDAAWSGFIDLQIDPDRVREIAEIDQLPALREALVRLNAHHSPVSTAKCDVWQPEEFDPDELDADPEDAVQCLACYVDLLSRTQQWSLPEIAQQSCESWRATLRNIPLTNCRVDLVIRQAWLIPDLRDIGVTAYVTACGSDLSSARAALNAALDALTDAIAPMESSSKRTSQYNGEKSGE